MFLGQLLFGTRLIFNADRCQHVVRQGPGLGVAFRPIFPEFAEWLAGLRIDSISLNPDAATALSPSRELPPPECAATERPAGERHRENWPPTCWVKTSK